MSNPTSAPVINTRSSFFVCLDEELGNPGDESDEKSSKQGFRLRLVTYLFQPKVSLHLRPAFFYLNVFPVLPFSLVLRLFQLLPEFVGLPGRRVRRTDLRERRSHLHHQQGQHRHQHKIIRGLI